MRIARPPEPDASLAWLGLLLHSTDSAYPIGGFAHSGGLEGLTGRDQLSSVEELHDFLHQEIVDTLRFVELPLLYHAWMAATAREMAPLVELDQLSEAARFGAEPRQASRRLGVQRWSLFNKLHASSMNVPSLAWIEALAGALPHKHLCVVAGVEAAAMGVPVAAAMTALAHQTVMMVAQASLKLIRVGQTGVQSLVAGLTQRYSDLVHQAMRMELDEVGTCLPRFDIGAAWHETAPARMFLS